MPHRSAFLLQYHRSAIRTSAPDLHTSFKIVVSCNIKVVLPKAADGRKLPALLVLNHPISKPVLLPGLSTTAADLADSTRHLKT